MDAILWRSPFELSHPRGFHPPCLRVPCTSVVWRYTVALTAVRPLARVGVTPAVRRDPIQYRRLYRLSLTFVSLAILDSVRPCNACPVHLPFLSEPSVNNESAGMHVRSSSSTSSRIFHFWADRLLIMILSARFAWRPSARPSLSLRPVTPRNKRKPSRSCIRCSIPSPPSHMPNNRPSFPY